MSDVFRFALLGLGLGALYARLPGPDGDLPRVGRAELRPRRHRVVGAYAHWEIKVKYDQPWLAWLAASRSAPRSALPPAR